MTPQELKESILRLAMKGRLTSQLDSDGNSADHLALIASYKKAHKIADNKKMLPISDEDIPFDIPDNWSWVRFGSIVNYRMGKTPPRAESQWWSADVSWVSIADMPENGFVSSTKEKVSQSAIDSVFGGRLSKSGTLLMSFKLTVGRVSILAIDAVHNEAIISIFPYCDENKVVQSYLFQLLPIISQYGDSKNAIKGKTLNDTSICNLMIPFPPLAEQKRIVAKIEELLPLIDRYEQAWTRLEDFNKRFPADMQKSLLQLAIQGKLVDQRPEEGTGEDLYRQIQTEKQALIRSGKLKKEKPLPEITEDEKPFDIPESWEWVRIGSIFNLQAGKNITSADIYSEASLEHLYPCYGGNGCRGFVTTYNRSGHYAIIGRQGALCGNVNYASGNFYATEHAVVVEQFAGTSVLWCGYFLVALNLNQYATATAQPGLAVANINQVLIPLPPLAEQKRIVAKLESLLPLCDKLKGAII